MQANNVTPATSGTSRRDLFIQGVASTGSSGRTVESTWAQARATDAYSGPKGRSTTFNPVPHSGFASNEHAAVGNAATHTEVLGELQLDDGSKLTFGDMVALSGDYFADAAQIRFLAGTPEGQQEIRWARWWAGVDTSAEPAVPAAVKQRVHDRAYELVSNNTSHFNGGGTAMAAYEAGHKEALRKAYMAGAAGRSDMFNQAVTDEAVCQHFLTDMFASGHVRTPIADVRAAYRAEMPKSLDQLINWISKRMVVFLDDRGDIPFFWPRATLQQRFADRIKETGKGVIDQFSLGDIVSLAQHDSDGGGLEVITDTNPNGDQLPNGFRWRCVGDGSLPKSEITWKMAVAGSRASRKELDRARKLGERVAKASDPRTAAARAERELRALESYEAKRYVPRDAPGANPPMEWRWGKMNPPMVAAIETAIRGTVVGVLRDNPPDPPVKRYDYGGNPDPNGPVILHVGEAYEAACVEMVQLGIQAIEQAVGSKAK